VVQVEVFRRMVSVRTSILEDLDVFPRTTRLPSTTPSTAKSRQTVAVTERCASRQRTYSHTGKWGNERRPPARLPTSRQFAR